MIQYKFIPLIGSKPKMKGIGLLTIDHGEAMFSEGYGDRNDKILGILKKPEITHLTSHGIFLKGFEPREYDKQGKEKFRYMEWYCSFILE